MTESGIGIVGAGYMGRMHASCYHRINGVRVVGVYDTDENAARRLADPDGATPVTSLGDLLSLPGLDAVSVCTPDAQHRTAAVAAARAGKHILLEKPLATSLADAEAILDAARSAEVTLAMGFVSRFIDSYSAARQAVASGNIGQVATIQARRLNTKAAGARVALRDNVVDFLAVHDVDLLHWFAGPISSVNALADSYGYADAEGPDTAQLLLRFSSGAIGHLHVSWAVPDTAPYRARAGLEVVGTSGIVSLDSFDDRVGIWADSGSRFPLDWQLTGAFQAQAEAFIASVRDGTPPVASGEDGMAALRVVLAARESIRTGGAPVYVEPSDGNEAGALADRGEAQG